MSYKVFELKLESKHQFAEDLLHVVFRGRLVFLSGGEKFLSLLLDNGTVTEAQAKQHVAELLLAVKHLHEKGIAHRYQEQYSRTQKPNAVWCVMACVSVCESCASATE